MKRKIMIEKAQKTIIKRLKKSLFITIAKLALKGTMQRIDSKDGNSYYISPVDKYCEVGKLFHYPSMRFERNIKTLPQDLYELWKYGLR